jgi:ABC-type polysaccharide/polyol phosphate export permease
MNTSKEIYDSSQRRLLFLDEIKDLIRYHDLVYQFVLSSIKTRYKRSVLGIVWTLLNPLLMMTVLTIVFSNFFRFSIPYYPVYVLSGLVFWNFISGSTNMAMQTMALSGSLLNRIFVPKSVFAVTAVGTGLVNLFLSLIPLFAIALILHMKLTASVLVMPFSILLMAMFALGLGMILQTAAVYFADMIPVYEVILSILFYATPIIYPREMIPPELAWMFQLNPLYHLVRVFRAPLFEGVIPGSGIWAVAIFSSVVTFIIGGLIFTSKSHEYAYRI